MKVTVADGTRAATIYGQPVIEEEFFCNYGLNPDYQQRLAAAGLSLSGNIISGTPTAAGTATITVTSSCGAQATLSVTIAACITPSLVADTLMGTVGLPFLFPCRHSAAGACLRSFLAGGSGFAGGAGGSGASPLSSSGSRRS